MRPIQTLLSRANPKMKVDLSNDDGSQSSGDEERVGGAITRPHYTFLLACGIGTGVFATALVAFTTRERPDAASVLAFTAIAATLLGAFAAFLFGVQYEEPEPVAAFVRGARASSRQANDVEISDAGLAFSVEMDPGFGADGAPLIASGRHTVRPGQNPLGLRRRRHALRRSSLITHQRDHGMGAAYPVTDRWDDELESERGLDLAFSDLPPWTPETSLHLDHRA